MQETPFKQLQGKFLNGLGWNGFFYFFYKILSTSLSFVLYTLLTTQDFSFWANINALTFLVLLWLDFGFRKSLPRYCPEFAHSPRALHRFIGTIIIFQGCVLLAAMPFLMIIQHNMYPSLSGFLYYSGTALLATEGIIALLRLIFHSHFFIKQFTLITSAVLLVEMATHFMVIILLGIRGTQLVEIILATKIIMGCTTILIGLTMLGHLYRRYSHPNVKLQEIRYYPLMRDFIQHSAMMWATNILKSLTERNFMVLILTIVFGPSAANMFKVANDGALLFHRMVVKTIGITDTTLLTHVGQLTEAKKLMPIAFTKIMTSIVALCLPLFGVVSLVAVFCYRASLDSFVFQLFFILVLSYLIESILSPYERILEVKRRYSKLIFAYSPYLIMLIFAFYLNLLTLIGLLKSMLLIQGVRLVSSLFMIPFARAEVLLLFPLRFTVKVFIVCLPIWLVLFVMYPYIIYPYIPDSWYRCLFRNL